MTKTRYLSQRALEPAGSLEELAELDERCQILMRIDHSHPEYCAVWSECYARLAGLDFDAMFSEAACAEELTEIRQEVENKDYDLMCRGSAAFTAWAKRLVELAKAAFAKAESVEELFEIHNHFIDICGWDDIEEMAQQDIYHFVVGFNYFDVWDERFLALADIDSFFREAKSLPDLESIGHELTEKCDAFSSTVLGREYRKRHNEWQSEEERQREEKVRLDRAEPFAVRQHMVKALKEVGKLAGKLEGEELSAVSSSLKSLANGILELCAEPRLKYTELENRSEMLEERIDELEMQVEDLTSRVEGLEEALEELKNREESE